MDPSFYVNVQATIAAATAAVVALTALVSSMIVLWQRIEQLRQDVDGRINQLLEVTRSAGHAEGVLLAQQLQHQIPTPAEAPATAADASPETLPPPR